MTEHRAINFNAGPSAIPLEVLQTAQAELVDYRGHGMSIMEMSHRGNVYEQVHDEAISLVREIMGVPDDYHVMFLTGGASLQFGMIPLNFLHSDRSGGYILTGSWSEKAFQEAAGLSKAHGETYGQAYVAGSTGEEQYQRIPSQEELYFQPDSAYVHVTSNNTIYGTQWSSFPDSGNIPLIADMSSDIMSRPLDVRQFAMIYAGAQKNLGPSGVTLVIARSNFIEGENNRLPTMLQYSTFAKNNSLYNTPPTFGVYMLGLVMQWIKDKGGLASMHAISRDKAAYIYDAIDSSEGFYQGHAERASRSLMNITFRVRDDRVGNETLEKMFADEAQKEGFIGLNGHRSVGGFRASTYNAVPVESCKSLSEFMINFQRRYG